MIYAVLVGVGALLLLAGSLAVLLVVLNTVSTESWPEGRLRLVAIWLAGHVVEDDDVLRRMRGDVSRNGIRQALLNMEKPSGHHKRDWEMFDMLSRVTRDRKKRMMRESGPPAFRRGGVLRDVSRRSE